MLSVGTVHIHFYKIYPKFSLHKGGKAEAVPRRHHQRLHSRRIPKTGASSSGKVFYILYNFFEIAISSCENYALYL
jgi:hypothetical protein